MHTVFCIGATNPFTHAYTVADWFGKVIIFSLFTLSILSWIVLVYKIWQTKQSKKISFLFQNVLEKRKDHLLSFDTTHAPKIASSIVPQPFFSIYASLKNKTVEMLNKKSFFLKQSGEEKSVYLTSNDMEILEQIGLVTLSSQHKLLEKHLFILPTIVTLAPFLGLLGTVWGILVTFAEIGTSNNSSAAMLGGLSTALATTVLGLLIAIPALVANNYLKSFLKTFATDMEDFLYSSLSTLELEYRKADIS